METEIETEFTGFRSSRVLVKQKRRRVMEILSGLELWIKAGKIIASLNPKPYTTTEALRA